MTRPSSGVKPIDVSSERPFAIAHAEQPAPSWSVTASCASGAELRACASARSSDSCAMP